MRGSKKPSLRRRQEAVLLRQDWMLPRQNWEETEFQVEEQQVQRPWGRTWLEF